MWTSASDRAVVGVESSCGRDDLEESLSEPACDNGGRGGKGGGVSSSDCIIESSCVDESASLFGLSVLVSPLGLPLLLTVAAAGGVVPVTWPESEFVPLLSGIASSGHAGPREEMSSSITYQSTCRGS